MYMYLMVTICKSSYCIMTKKIYFEFVYLYIVLKEEHSVKIDVR